ncbi:hypothetical protein HV819_09340 [Anaerococcus sp. AGMB00486]|nr:S41 family peptidase [Anaerococcus porci]NVF12157.1 hypothetical protein [Anaerococcus faecalis]
MIGIEIMLKNNKLVIYENNNINYKIIAPGDEVQCINDNFNYLSDLLYNNYNTYKLILKDKANITYSTSIMMPNIIKATKKNIIDEDNNIIYLYNFNNSDLRDIKLFLEVNNKDYIVLDLSDNMGGKLYDIFPYLSIFLEKDSLIRFYSKDKTYIKNIYAYDYTKKRKIIIKVNNNTSSSAELFINTLCANNDDVIIYGEKTSNKNISQIIYSYKGISYSIPVLRFDLNLINKRGKSEKKL